MFNHKGIKVLLLAIISALVLSACGDTEDTSSDSNESNEGSDKPTIDMGQISWAENIAVTNMWKVILEEQGYDVEFHLLEMGTQMEALANDELDINVEIWLPVQDAEYVQQYEDKINFSEETWYDNAKVGLVVPSFMEEINSIEDLNDHKEELDGQITGFDPGAGTMLVVQDVIEEYDLDYELLPSSEPAMLEELEKAIDKEEPIIVPLWNPHRVFSSMDLKYLEDPQKMFGEVEKIHHATRLGFSDDYPEVSEWVKNWKMGDEAIGDLMSYVKEAEDEGKEAIDGAEKWVEDNQDLVDEWIQ
ncbi:glycine betaine/proline transport system substrate-binding protein [Oceanobacillus limi]|uniref:Glycine betaine/proline transport system substrate-binding protein n=1 Tax=Oceanobacillus limi TaxID=930131 RepID=A0A1I0AAF9_9BACI|nr:glycine betaine ABC transporter substrate-binding protein [Oceanobacillus limi]SES91198.1 glycine betaine/proline transport system substrate-binding protein [Oceanobacillus limi]